MPKYIFRLDDIAPNMHWARYFELKRVLDQYGVKPLLGVIPDNQDPQLRQFPECDFDFWAHIREQQAAGWDIALHGHQHRFTTRDAGILGINRFSEFAGLPLSEQRRKVQKGLRVFAANGVVTDTFMAPAHSFDRTTLEALKSLGVFTVSDGHTLYPTWKDGVLMVPQLFATPRRMPLGVHTFCLHVNWMTHFELARVATFLKRHHGDVIPFSHCRRFVIPAWPQKPVNFSVHVARFVRRLATGRFDRLAFGISSQSTDLFLGPDDQAHGVVVSD